MFLRVREKAFQYSLETKTHTNRGSIFGTNPHRNKQQINQTLKKVPTKHMADYTLDRPHNNANKIPSDLSYKIASPPSPPPTLPPPFPPPATPLPPPPSSSLKQPQQQRQFYLIQKSCHATDRPATNQSKGDTSAPSCSSKAINVRHRCSDMTCNVAPCGDGDTGIIGVPATAVPSLAINRHLAVPRDRPCLQRQSGNERAVRKPRRAWGLL